MSDYAYKRSFGPSLSDLGDADRAKVESLNSIANRLSRLEEAVREIAAILKGGTPVDEGSTQEKDS